MTLKQFIKKQHDVYFRYTHVRGKTARDGTRIIIFTLAKPIKMVRGSENLYDPVTKELSYPTTYNVKEINVVEDDLTTVEKTRTNKYGGGIFKRSGLLMDVARSGSVWLRKESFASSYRTYRSKMKELRVKEVLGK